MNISLRPLSFALVVLLATACTPASETPPPASQTEASAASAAEPGMRAPVDQFLSALARHCGQAYAGRIVANEPKPTTPDAFEGKPLVMHVRGCDDPANELRIPFHVGDDHSRTWVLTRTPDALLRLKHDHRHADGSPDTLTMYGGQSVEAGTPDRQAFPVDQESVELFEREGLNASVTNTWAMEIEPDRYFRYELSRPGGRLFKVEFDLSQPVPLPPAPWGAEAAVPAGS